MRRQVALLGVFVVGLLTLSDGTTAEGAGRRGRRCGSSCTAYCGPEAPCHAAPPAYAPAPFTEQLYRVYCCDTKTGLLINKGDYPASQVQGVINNCVQNQNCSMGFSTEVPTGTDTTEGSPCPGSGWAGPGGPHAEAAVRSAPKCWYVYCCCNGCWRFAGCFKDYDDAACAGQRCKCRCHCTKTIVSYGPMDPSVVPCPGGCG